MRTQWSWGTAGCLAVAAATILTAQACPNRYAVPWSKQAFDVSGRIRGDARRFSPGQHVPLEVVIRNPTQEEQCFCYLGAWWWTGPSLEVARDGERVKVRESRTFGTNPIHCRPLKAGETVVLKHPGLWLGEPDPKRRADPSVPAPRPGTYRVRLIFPEVDKVTSRPVRLREEVGFECVAPAATAAATQRAAVPSEAWRSHPALAPPDGTSRRGDRMVAAGIDDPRVLRELSRRFRQTGPLRLVRDGKDVEVEGAADFEARQEYLLRLLDHYWFSKRRLLGMTRAQVGEIFGPLGSNPDEVRISAGRDSFVIRFEDGRVSEAVYLMGY